MDQRVTGDGGGRGEDQRHDETQDWRPQRGKQDRKHTECGRSGDDANEARANQARAGVIGKTRDGNPSIKGSA